MQTARNSTIVKLAPDKTRGLWDQWVTEHGQPSEEVRAQFSKAGADLDAEKGRVAFEPANGEGTEVIMDLQYNPDVVQESGLSGDWVEQRISQYLDRFREFAES